MSGPGTYGRETVLIVEIEQRRCSNRFGVAPCTATGTPLCYQSFTTCRDRSNFNVDGVIRWRFCRPQDQTGWLYEQADSNDISTNCIPILRSVSTTSSTINLGASRKGESPLGTRARVTIEMQDAPWDDHVGDFYVNQRSLSLSRPGFWALWTARNQFYPNFLVRVYEGYKGQALADMQTKLYDLESVDGPDATGAVRIVALDPLDKARGKKAKFPRTSQIDLASDIDAVTLSVPVTCLENELTAPFGNTGTRRYIVIDNEILQYTGFSGTAPDFVLSGVLRGVLGTLPDDHTAGDAVQRVGRYENERLYRVARDLLMNHTEVDNSYVDTGGQWETEGSSFLSTLACNTTIAEPEGVEDILGELCRDGLFSIWWDERLQRIPLLAVRPPQEVPRVITDQNNIVEGSFQRETRPDDRMTRVSIFFGLIDPLEPLDEERNYRNRRIRIDGEVELPVAAGGEILENTIFSRWSQTFSNALLVGASLLLRYRLPPQYLSIVLDAKDRDLQIGDVVDIETPTTKRLVDFEGNAISTRWQVISISEPRAGETVSARLQSYAFVGRFSIIMANDAPIYADATEEERLVGCWLADDATGLMPNGDEPYLLQ